MIVSYHDNAEMQKKTSYRNNVQTSLAVWEYMRCIAFLYFVIATFVSCKCVGHIRNFDTSMSKCFAMFIDVETG